MKSYPTLSAITQTIIFRLGRQTFITAMINQWLTAFYLISGEIPKVVTAAAASYSAE